MSGAWELLQQHNVLCAVLHTDNTTVAWSFGIRNLIIPGQVLGLAGMPFDHARNAAAKHCLDHGFQHLFFLDSDVIPPHDALLRLLAHKKPVISGVYHRRSPPAGVPVAIKNGSWLMVPPNSGVVEVDLVGAGCLLIRRDVLEQFPPHRPGKPWFDWRVDMQGHLPQGECLSEDFTFCAALKQKMGIPVLLDTSVQCRHVGYSQATWGAMNPLDTMALV